MAKGEHVPPQRVRAAAKQGLEMHKRGEAGDGLEAATVTRARRIAAGEALTDAHVKRMHSFFERHDKTRPADGGSGKSPWRTAWMLWGGDSGRRWAASVVKDLQEGWLTNNGFKVVETDNALELLETTTIGRVFRSLRNFNDDQPRWPKGAPHGKGGQWMQVGERFMWNGSLYEISSIHGKRVTAHIADGGPRPSEVILSPDEQRDAVPVAPSQKYDMETYRRRDGWGDEQQGVPIVAAHPDPSTHDASLDPPDWLDEDAWKRFGRADQLHLLRLEERFGDAWANNSAVLIDRLAADYSGRARSAVQRALGSQYNASTGNTLNLAEQRLSPAEYEEARLLFRDCAEALQYDLYRQLESPDVSVFHGFGSSGRSVSEIRTRFMEDRTPVMSGLSCTGVFDVAHEWGPTVLGFPLAIRHVEMATDLGGLTLNHEDEHEIATSSRLLLDPDQLFVASGVGDDEDALSPMVARFLEQNCQVDGVGSGQVIRDAIAAIRDPQAELPLVAEDPNLSHSLGPPQTQGKPVLADAVEVAKKAKPRGKKLRASTRVLEDMKPGELMEQVGIETEPGGVLDKQEVSLLPEDAIVALPDGKWIAQTPAGGGDRRLERLDAMPRVIDKEELANLPTGAVVRVQVPMSEVLDDSLDLPDNATITITSEDSDVVPVALGDSPYSQQVFHLTRTGIDYLPSGDNPTTVIQGKHATDADQARIRGAANTGSVVHSTVIARRLPDGSFGLQGIGADGTSLDDLTLDADELGALGARFATDGNGIVPVRGRALTEETATLFDASILPSLPVGAVFTYGGRKWERPPMSEKQPDRREAIELLPTHGDEITEDWLRADSAPEGFRIECNLLNGHTRYGFERVGDRWKLTVMADNDDDTTIDGPALRVVPGDDLDPESIVLSKEKAQEAKTGTRLLYHGAGDDRIFEKRGADLWVSDKGTTLSDEEMGDDNEHRVLQWPSKDQIVDNVGEDPPRCLLSPTDLPEALDDSDAIPDEDADVERKKQVAEALKRRLERLPEGTQLVRTDYGLPERDEEYGWAQVLVVRDGRFVSVGEEGDKSVDLSVDEVTDQIAKSLALSTDDELARLVTRFVIRSPRLRLSDELTSEELADRYGAVTEYPSGRIAQVLESRNTGLYGGLMDFPTEGAVRVLSVPSEPLAPRDDATLVSFPDGYDPTSDQQRFVLLPRGTVVRVDEAALDLPYAEVLDEDGTRFEGAELRVAIMQVNEPGVVIRTYEGTRFQSVFHQGSIQWRLIEEGPGVDYGDTDLSDPESPPLIIGRASNLLQAIATTEGLLDLRYETPWKEISPINLTHGVRYRRLTRKATLDAPDQSFVPMSRGQQAALTPVGKPRFLYSFPEGALVRLEGDVYRVTPGYGERGAATGEFVELESVTTGLLTKASPLTRTCALEVGSHVITADSPPKPGTPIIVSTDNGTVLGTAQSVSRGKVSVLLPTSDGSDREVRVRLADCAGLPTSHASPTNVEVGDEFVVNGANYRVAGVSEDAISAEPVFDPETGQARLGDVRVFPRDEFAPVTHWRPTDWATGDKVEIGELGAGDLVVSAMPGAPVYQVLQVNNGMATGRSLDTGEIIQDIEVGGNRVAYATVHSLRRLVTKQSAGSDEIEPSPSEAKRARASIVLRKPGDAIPEPSERVAGGEITGALDSREASLDFLPLYARVSLRDSNGNVVKTLAKTRNEEDWETHFTALDASPGPYGNEVAERFSVSDLALSATGGYTLHVEPHDGALSPIMGRTFEDLTDGYASRDAIRSVLSDLADGDQIAEYDGQGDSTVYRRSEAPDGFTLPSGDYPTESGWMSAGVWITDEQMAEIISFSPREHRVRPSRTQTQHVGASPELLDGAPIGTELEVGVTGAQVRKIATSDGPRWVTDSAAPALAPSPSPNTGTILYDDEAYDWLLGGSDMAVGDVFWDKDGDEYEVTAIPDDGGDEVFRRKGSDGLVSADWLEEFFPLELQRDSATSSSVPEVGSTITASSSVIQSAPVGALLELVSDEWSEPMIFNKVGPNSWEDNGGGVHTDDAMADNHPHYVRAWPTGGSAPTPVETAPDRFDEYEFVEGEPVRIAKWPTGTTMLDLSGGHFSAVSALEEAPEGSTVRGSTGMVFVKTGREWVAPLTPEQKWASVDLVGLLDDSETPLSQWTLTSDSSGLELLRPDTRVSVLIPTEGQMVPASQSLLDSAPVGTILKRGDLKIMKAEAYRGKPESAIWRSTRTDQYANLDEDELAIGDDYTVIDWPEVDSDLVPVTPELIAGLPRLLLADSLESEFLPSSRAAVTRGWSESLPVGAIVAFSDEGDVFGEMSHFAVKVVSGLGSEAEHWTLSGSVPPALRDSFKTATMSGAEGDFRVRVVSLFSDLPEDEEIDESLLAVALNVAADKSQIRLESSTSEIGVHPPGTELHLVKQGGSWRQATEDNPGVATDSVSEVSSEQIAAELGKPDVRALSDFHLATGSKAAMAFSIREGALAEDGEGNLWKIKASGDVTWNGGEVVVTDGQRNYRLSATTRLVERTDLADMTGQITTPVTDKAPFVDKSPDFNEEPVASQPRVPNRPDALDPVKEGEQFVTREALMTRLPQMPVGIVLLGSNGEEYRLDVNDVQDEGGWLVSKGAWWTQSDGTRTDVAGLTRFALPLTVDRLLTEDEQRTEAIAGRVFEYDEDAADSDEQYAAIMSEMRQLPVGTVLEDREGDRYQIMKTATSDDDKVMSRTMSSGNMEGGINWSFDMVIEWTPVTVVTLPSPVTGNPSDVSVGDTVLATRDLVDNAPVGAVLRDEGGDEWKRLPNDQWVSEGSPNGVSVVAMADDEPHVVVAWPTDAESQLSGWDAGDEIEDAEMSDIEDVADKGLGLFDGNELWRYVGNGWWQSDIDESQRSDMEMTGLSYTVEEI